MRGELGVMTPMRVRRKGASPRRLSPRREPVQFQAAASAVDRIVGEKSIDERRFKALLTEMEENPSGAVDTYQSLAIPLRSAARSRPDLHIPDFRIPKVPRPSSAPPNRKSEVAQDEASTTVPRGRPLWDQSLPRTIHHGV
eukprot:Sspe_Gene.36919::Locus_17832_Transcript_1_1_Confidence_1.000_Length_455::g.36919::m.36919